MNKVIIPTGYMGSGSSAITDLVAEFKNCKNEFKSYEYVLLHCPNGLFCDQDAGAVIINITIKAP